MDDRTSPRARVAELDGLRGLAIIAVVLAHYVGEVEHGIRLFAHAWIAVNVFFALSGFLIGGILLDNRDAPRYYSAFYARRACRIFPLYFLVIPAVLGALAWFHRSAWAVPPLPGLAYLTYTQNVVACIRGQDRSWLLPTWTLAVEEQFYLLLPPLILAVRPALIPAASVAAIASAPVLRAAFLEAPPPTQVGAYVLLPCRWDILFFGVLAAAISRDSRLRGATLKADAFPLKSACLSGMWGYVALAFIDVRTGVPIAHTFGLSLIGLFSGSYILLITRGASDGRFLRSSVLRFFGTISYGLYLVHEPINGLAHGLILDATPDVGTLPSAAVTALAATISVAVAWLSWTYIESPIVRFGLRWEYRPHRPPVKGR